MIETSRGLRGLRHVAVLAVLAMSLASAPLAASAQEQPQPNPIRLEGADAVTASIAFSEATFESSPAVLVGRSDDWPDNLASGGLQSDDTPLLLTDTDALSEGIAEEIERLGATSATVLGGNEAVSPEVEEELEGLGLSTDRLFGDTRIETAIEVARAVDSDATEAVVARAFDGEIDTQGFADALSAGGFVADRGIPLLLTATEELSDQTSEYLEESDIEEVTIVGGTAAVSQEVEDAVDALGITVTRIGGAERAETAVGIAEERGFDDAADADRIILIDQGTRPDAFAPGFAAAAHSALFDAPIVLAFDNGLPDATEDFLVTNSDAVLVCAPFVTVTACDEARDALGITDVAPPPVVETFVPAGDVTQAPELVDVELEDDQGETVLVRYTFDEQVLNPVSESITVVAVDGLVFGAIDAEVAGDDNTAVIAEFTDDVYDEATVAAVDAGAVEDVSNVTNPEGAVPLQAVTLPAGVTFAPDLIGVGAFSAAGNSAVFTFDENATPTAAGTPDQFGLVLADGTVFTGLEILSGQGTPSLTVRFDSTLTQEQFNTTVRGFVGSGAVDDGDTLDGAQVNPFQVIELIEGGDTTAELNLVEVDLALADQGIAVFTFDAPVNPAGTAEDFFVYDRSGIESAATLVEDLTINANSVQVTFEPGVLSGRTVGGSVDSGAVDTAESGSRLPNLADEVPIAPVEFASGETEGPLLTEVEVVGLSDSQRVIFTFDRPLDQPPADPSLFRLYAADGEQFAGTLAAQNGSNTNQVLVTFEAATAQDIRSAPLAAVAAGAVVGSDGISDQKPNFSFAVELAQE